ncbi:hypothetical protein [Candidatus Amarolinea dominans]|uniref:hypothetical protein n=1 Tax=Candidatus Amarolinea dominans TaxID=3140696 RepID=UPI001DDF60A2|nr:hypothetical protein [Anaerolineae bacterium]
MAGVNQPFKIEHWLRDDGPGRRSALRLQLLRWPGGRRCRWRAEGGVERGQLTPTRLGLVVQQSVPYTLTVGLGTYEPVEHWG